MNLKPSESKILFKSLDAISESDKRPEARIERQAPIPTPRGMFHLLIAHAIGGVSVHSSTDEESI